MPALRTYNLFISHAWNYNDEYYKMVNFLNDASNFSWKNYSVPEHDPLPMNVFAKKLPNQISPVSAVIILAGMYVPRHDWILTEIEIAKRYNKPIIGVRPWGAQVVPTAVQSVAKEIVGWNTASIVDAIRRCSL
jgi:hypothetical protein